MLPGSPDPIRLEHELEDRLRGYKIVFELGLDSETVGRARDTVERIARGAPEPERLLASAYPAVLLAYLVGEANDRYDGAFWEHLPVKTLDLNKLRAAFERAVSKLDLEPFTQAAQEGFRYVSPILAHGGIPRFSADDYWSLVLSSLDELPGADAEELIRVWRGESATFDRIDRPVQRFLLYGGSVAQNFVQRCIDLATFGAGEHAAEFELPEHIVAAYEHAGEDEDETRRSRRAQLMRPSIRLDPWARGGPELQLPAVPGPLARGEWLVNAGNETARYSCSAREVTPVPLTPADQWTVEFSSGDLLRPFAFEGDVAGAMVFDPRTETYRPTTRTIALSNAWLLVAPGVDVTAITRDGSASPLGAVARPLVTLGGAWTQHRLLDTDLTDLAQIVVHRPGSAEPDLPIEIVDPALRPALVGRPVPDVIGGSGVDVYARAPSLRVPELGGAGFRRWSVGVRSDGAIRRASREDLDSNNGVIDLARLIPPDYLGEVELAARGPLGRDLSASFAIAPGLEVELPPRLILPGEESSVLLFIDDDVAIDGIVGGALERAVGAQDVSIHARLTRAGRALSIRVAIPRVVWSLQGERATPLGAEQITVDLEELRARTVDSLLVATQRPDVRVCVLLAVGSQIIDRGPVATTQTRRGLYRFGLGQFTDSVVNSGECSLDLRLEASEQVVPLGRVIASVQATDIGYEVSERGETAEVRLFWREEYPLRGRSAVLWPLDPPDAALVRPTSTGQAPEAFFSVASLPPGRYRAEISVSNEWRAPTRPQRGARSTADLLIAGTPDDQVSPSDLLRRSLRELQVPEAWTADLTAQCADTLVRAVVGYAAEAVDLDEWARSSLAAKLLFANHLRAFDAIVAAASALSPADRIALAVHGLEAPNDDVEPRTMESLWQLVPALAAIRDVPRLWRADRIAIARCRAFLGWSETSRLPVPGAGVEHGRWMAMSSAELRSSVAPLPLPLLSAETFMDANAEWIAAATEEPIRMQEWWEQFGSCSTRRDLPPLADAYVRARRPAEGLPSSAGFPMATLVYACDAIRRVGSPDSARALVLASGIAPRLVMRDICLAAVLASVPATDARRFAMRGITTEPALRDGLARHHRSQRVLKVAFRRMGPITDAELTAHLLSWRERKAMELQRRPMQRFVAPPSEAALVAIAKLRPKTLPELAVILSTAGLAAYGEEILETVRSAGASPGTN